MQLINSNLIIKLKRFISISRINTTRMYKMASGNINAKPNQAELIFQLPLSKNHIPSPTILVPLSSLQVPHSKSHSPRTTFQVPLSYSHSPVSKSHTPSPTLQLPHSKSHSPSATIQVPHFKSHIPSPTI